MSESNISNLRVERRRCPCHSRYKPQPIPKIIKHPNIKCNCCEEIIENIRYKCLDCIDINFCDICEKYIENIHYEGEHVLAKIRDSRILKNKY